MGQLIHLGIRSVISRAIFVFMKPHTAVWILERDELSQRSLQREIRQAMGPIQFRYFSEGLSPFYLLCKRVEGPEYIFVEANLPHMSGLDFLRQLKKTGLASESCMILMSRDPGVLDLEGIEDIQLITKPVDQRTLAELFASLGGRRKSA